MRIRREVVGALCALLVTACAAAAAGPDDGSAHSIPTIVDGVGVLPAPVSMAPSAPSISSSTTLVRDSTSAPTTEPGTTTTALHAEGNRVLLLGDSILASTSSRYSNDTCKALIPLGWNVEVEAEVSRGIQFGNQVLATRKNAGWDVGVVFLGTNNGSTENEEYLRQLNKIITTFSPAPVVLITVGEFRPEMKAINDTIRAVARLYPDRVSVLDWNHIIQTTPGLVREDGIHLTVPGRQVLAEAIASHLGTAPASPGKCLASVFTDDSAGSVNGPSGSGGTATTVRPQTTQTTAPTGSTGSTTTVKPSTSTTTGGGTVTTVSSSGPTTVPATVASTMPPIVTTIPPLPTPAPP